MKKNVTRLIAGALAVLMCGGLAACKPQEGGEQASDKLQVFFMDAKTPDVEKVAAEVSKITKEKLGFEVEFTMFDAGTYSTKLPMMIATDEPMDICWTDINGFADKVRQGAFAELDDLLINTAPDLYNLFENKDFWKGVSVDGKIYAVPTLKEMAEQWIVSAETDFLEEIGFEVDPDKVYTLKEVEPILEALQNYPERPGFTIGAGGAHNSIHKLNYFDVVLNDFVVSKETGKVENYYLTKEFEEYAYLMRDWFNKGYIASDITTRENYEEYGPGKQGLSVAGYAPYNEILWTSHNKNDAGEIIPVSVIKVTPSIVSNASTCGSTFAILEKSKRKEDAIKFLELWNTDPEVKNLITYGIEGEHYEMIDGKIKQADDVLSRYLNQNWASGNVLISHLIVGEPDDKWEKFAEFNAGAEISSTLGFVPDVKAVNDKILACQGAAAEYTGLLSCGAVDPDVYLPQLREAMEAAGVADVTAELQAQYDAWKVAE